MTNKVDEKFMREAVKLSCENVENGGGPFGALVVLKDEIIGIGFNRVTEWNDPTAHAEVNAIRDACKKLNSYDLSDCIIYTSCEPCPMCLGAIYWSRLKAIYYGNTKNDAASIGFDDQFIYEEIERAIDKRNIPTTQVLAKEAYAAFKLWDEKKDKIRY